MAAKKPQTPLSVETIKHDDATRKSISSAEWQSILELDEQSPVR